MNPYIIDAPQMQGQDPQGLSPVFQNANAQQQYMNQQLGQSGQLGQYQNYGTSQGGAGALALANALRKNPTDLSDSKNMMGYGVKLPDSNVNPYQNMSSYNNNTYAGSGGNYGSGTGGFE